MNNQTNVSDCYFSLVLNYVKTQSEASLVQASELGSRLVEEDIPLEDLAELQENAIKHICAQVKGSELIHSLGFVYTPFMEMLVAYGMASRAQADHVKEQSQQLKISNQKFQTIVDQVNSLYDNVTQLKNHTTSIPSNMA